jgi:glycopeptide antibiotics resistance protein
MTDGGAAGISRRPLVGLATLFMAFAVYGGLVPFDFKRLAIHDAVAQFAAIPYVPVTQASKSDLLTNVLLFVPIGFFLLGALAAHSLRVALLVWPFVAAAGFVFAAAIEFGQIFVAGRTSSWNDVAAETAGAALGGAFWLLAGPRLATWVRAARHSPTPADRLYRILGVYGALWLVLGLLPFDYTIRPQELAEKFRAGRILLQPFGPETTAADVVRTFIMAVPIGAFGFLWGRHAGHRHPAPLGLAIGVAATAVVELAQLLAMSRTADVTDILVNIAGVGVGVWLGLTAGRRAAAPPGRVKIWPLAALVAWIVLLTIRHWSPFDFVADGATARSRVDLMLRVPFHSYYWGMPINAFAEAASKFLLGVPVGALLQWSWLPAGARERRLLAIGIGLFSGMLFLAIEIGQVLVPSRVPDQTDIYIGLAGSLVGAQVVRLVGQSERS